MALTSAVVEGDPIAAANAVSLRHATDNMPGIARQRHGTTFRYVTGANEPVRDASPLSRIRALAGPPACRRSYVHPRALEDFASDRLAKQLARQLERRCHGPIEVCAETIGVELQRAVEPLVARYLADQRNQRRA